MGQNYFSNKVKFNGVYSKINDGAHVINLNDKQNKYIPLKYIPLNIPLTKYLKKSKINRSLTTYLEYNLIIL